MNDSQTLAVGEHTDCSGAPDLRVQVADGVEYADRDVCFREARAVVLLRRFRGNRRTGRVGRDGRSS